jgi:hypothetical protein
MIALMVCTDRTRQPASWDVMRRQLGRRSTVPVADEIGSDEAVESNRPQTICIKHI